MDLRRTVVLVAGDGANPHRDKSIVVGEWIAQSGCHLLTGGGGGVMAAVTETFVECAGRQGMAIGVIPGSVTSRNGSLEYQTKGSAYPNISIELAVFTHLPGDDPEGPQSRNHINVLSADLVVALPGGPGTHAEIQLAKRYGKPVILFLGGGDEISGRTAADLAAEGFTIVRDFLSFIAAANSVLHPGHASGQPVRQTLKTCVLRSWTWNDAESLQRHANNREVWRNLHDGFPYPYTVRDARRWLAHVLSASPETAFALEVDREAVGGIGFVLKDGPSSRMAEVGYWLSQTYWGRGIATEALKALTAMVLANYPDICRLYAQVFEWNRASMRVLEKAGYERECILRKSAVKAGEVIDMAQYALIR